MEADGVPIKVNRRKAIALLAYLVMTGQSHSRDRLATLLWPAYDQRRARTSLRSTLTTLNSTPFGTCLVIDQETVGLAPEVELWVDAIHFQKLLAARQRHDHPLEE